MHMHSVFCFFFSSRRRHTRCSRDWSSDVCSSDLRVRLAVDAVKEFFLVQKEVAGKHALAVKLFEEITRDRKSTRLNSSHGYISYAVFCLKKKKQNVQHESYQHYVIEDYMRSSTQS